MKVLPSTSSMWAPEARRMKSGAAPTALNARTGLSTPPGRICCARAKSERDRLMRIFTTEDTKDTKENTLSERSSRLNLRVLGVLRGGSDYEIARAASRA